jgi:hypothetical protein
MHQKIIGQNHLYLAQDSPSELVLTRSKAARRMALGELAASIIFLAGTAFFVNLAVVLFRMMGIDLEAAIFLISAMDLIGYSILAVVLGMILAIILAGIATLFIFCDALRRAFIAVTFIFSKEFQTVQLQRSLLGKTRSKTILFNAIQEVALKKTERQDFESKTPIIKQELELQLTNDKSIPIAATEEALAFPELAYWHHQIQNMVLDTKEQEEVFRGHLPDPEPGFSISHLVFFLITAYDESWAEPTIASWDATRLKVAISTKGTEKVIVYSLMILLPGLWFCIPGPIMENPFIDPLIPMIFWAIMGIALVPGWLWFLNGITYAGAVEINFQTQQIEYEGGGILRHDSSTYTFAEVEDVLCEISSISKVFILLKNQQTIPITRKESKDSETIREYHEIADRLKSLIC